jgi:hypothetical protein
VPRRWPLALLLATFVAGCADPYQQETHRADSSNPARPSRGDERPPPASARETAPTVATTWAQTPRAAVDAFCSQWANWNWKTIGRQQRRLASLATGVLARQLTAEASLRAQDQALRRDRLGARGHVIAIDVKGEMRRRDAVCVAREESLADGRVDVEGGRHRVYLASVAHTERGWAVTRWEPQP